MSFMEFDEAIEEDVSLLQFPKEFQDAETLLISEVHLLLEHRKKQTMTADVESDLSNIFLKTHAYTETFRQFKTKEAAVEVRRILSQKSFHKFELAAIGNLCPTSVDEAKCLIPSLEGRISDFELQEVLDEIRLKRSL